MKSYDYLIKTKEKSEAGTTAFITTMGYSLSAITLVSSIYGMYGNNHVASNIAAASCGLLFGGTTIYLMYKTADKDYMKDKK